MHVSLPEGNDYRQPGAEQFTIDLSATFSVLAGGVVDGAPARGMKERAELVCQSLSGLVLGPRGWPVMVRFDSINIGITRRDRGC
jgi:hypothetical protein